MTGPHRILQKLRLLFLRDKWNRDLDEEMAFHRDQLQRELREEGMSPDQARLVSQHRFGDSTRAREASSDEIRFRWESAWQDVRYSLRQLRNAPAFAVTAVLILGLGIGASTAIFSVVNPILFRPLPYPGANRLTMLWEDRGGKGHAAVAYGTFHGLQERSRSFEFLAAMKPWQPTMTSTFEPERLEGQSVTADYFRVLGIEAATGRTFAKSEDVARGPKVVILSDKLLRRRFNGDAAIVGHDIKLDDNLYNVIGIMPDTFENVLQPEAEIWTPLQYDLSQGQAWGHHLRMAGRLKEGITAEQARSELDAILKGLARDYASGFAQGGGVSRGIPVTSLQRDMTASVRPALLAIMGAVFLLLLISCVNVTNLLLARSAQRRGEMAMRAALGAGRWRLVRQRLTESLLLAGLGGMLGMGIAQGGVRALLLVNPPDLPRFHSISVDHFAFAFALALTTVVGLVVGLMPAIQASRTDLLSSSKQVSGREARESRWTRAIFVIAEVSLAVVLLVSAGLLLRSLQGLFRINPGFDAGDVMTMEVHTSGKKFVDNAATHRFFSSALDAVRALPGVESASFTTQLPLSGTYDAYGMRLEPQSDHPPAEYGILRYSVTPGYFATMRIPIREGRAFTDRDDEAAPPVAIVSESFAKAEFPNATPIGRRLQIGPRTRWFTIVGVVANVKQSSLALDDLHQIYTTTRQWHAADSELTLVVRSHLGAASLVPAIKRAIWSVDKDQPIVRVATLESLVKTSEAQRRFALILFQTFALVALILAATGIYGVLSGTVTERTREIGVRAALGATPAKVVALVIRQGMTLTVVGVIAGVVGAALASRALMTLLFGISNLDAATYAGVIAMLLVVSGIACWLPAWRAAHVDPAITLRSE